MSIKTYDEIMGDDCGHPVYHSDSEYGGSWMLVCDECRTWEKYSDFGDAATMWGANGWWEVSPGRHCHSESWNCCPLPDCRAGVILADCIDPSELPGKVIMELCRDEYHGKVVRDVIKKLVPEDNDRINLTAAQLVAEVVTVGMSIVKPDTPRNPCLDQRHLLMAWARWTCECYELPYECVIRSAHEKAAKQGAAFLAGALEEELDAMKKVLAK